VAFLVAFLEESNAHGVVHDNNFPSTHSSWLQEGKSHLTRLLSQLGHRGEGKYTPCEKLFEVRSQFVTLTKLTME
jgi:hypothetical protein